MRKTLCSIAVIAALSVSATVAVSAQERIDLLTAPFGTGSYVLGNALEQIVNSATDAVSLTSSESPGLVFNVKKINSDPELRRISMMAYTPGLEPMATTGTGPFDQKYPSAKLIANYNLNTLWLASLDDSIRTKEDLVGKRVAVGRPPQIGWTIQALQIVEHGWGLRDDIEFETLGLDQGVKSAMAGQVDAIVVGGYLDPEEGQFLPSPHTNELLASGRSLYHISWGQEAVEATIAAGAALNPATIPAGVIDGLESEIEAFTSPVAWCVYDEFDDEAAYQITKAIIEQVDLFAEYHALGKLMSRSALVTGWETQDIHPGALRAYREAGIVE
ncbi:MAG: TAXI family TRAP transporter solute-binding subunit [Rhizobiaceae bacterium]|nr:TAXI family TRAP transporter solute-binding subunit [Rhizobiaceae bacterium]